MYLNYNFKKINFDSIEPQQSPIKYSHFDVVPLGLNLVIHEVSYAKISFKTVPLKETHM
jgi:hypothetical protein